MSDRNFREIQRTMGLDPQDPYSWSRMWRVLSRAHGLPVLLELFYDREVWNRADEALQSMATAVLSSLVKDSFDFIKIENFWCNDIEHNIPVYRHRKTEMLMMAIPGGLFYIGSDLMKDGYAFLDEIPRKIISIKPFFIGKYPVLQKEWDVVGGRDRRRWPDPDRPINSVSWNDIKKWFDKEGSILRLPSESEWEYACRAGSQDRFFWGHEFDPSFCWYDGNTGGNRDGTVVDPRLHNDRTNAFGLVDTVGNVFEWCEDDWHDSHEKTPDDGSPCIIRTGAFSERNHLKVLKGGSYEDASHWMRCALKLEDDPSHSFAFAGFRAAASWPEHQRISF